MLFAAQNEEKLTRQRLIEHIYNEYRPWLVKRAFKKIPNEDICEDIFQDCILSCISHIDTLESMNDAAIRRYLAVSVDNRCINYLKKNTKIVFTENDIFYGKDIEDAERNLETEVEGRLMLEDMMREFKKLPEKDREILVMKYSLRMKDKEIAPVFNIKESSVRMTVRRGVSRLTKMIKEGRRYE